MCFEKYLLQQIAQHPSMQPQDVAKLCYQAAYGAEHLLEDVSAAAEYFRREFETVPAGDSPLYEYISPDYARVNLAAWKKSGMPGAWLFALFCAGAGPNEQGREVLENYLGIAEENLSDFSFSFQSWREFIEDYSKRGMPALHHSALYRQAERPAYRLVRRDMLRVLPVLEAAAKCEKRPCIIAIDGCAGSGKSTMAALLSTILAGDVVHMDDFFLPPALRTAERLSQPGGNVHYERYAEEVLPQLRYGEAFEYTVFSCRIMDFDGARKIRNSNYVIVEGSYSLHPHFGDYADIPVFSDIEPEEQLSRLRIRNGEAMAKVFKDKWIPMEEMYFEEFDIPNRCGLVL